jgi:hypothetical protein
MQEKRGICMAQLLRELIYESMEKEITEKWNDLGWMNIWLFSW